MPAYAINNLGAERSLEALSPSVSAGSSGLHSAFAFFVPQGPQQNLKRENELACVCANQGLSVYKQRTGRGLAGGHLPVAIGKRIRDTLVPCAASRAARRSTYTAVVYGRDVCLFPVQLSPGHIAVHEGVAPHDVCQSAPTVCRIVYLNVVAAHFWEALQERNAREHAHIVSCRHTHTRTHKERRMAAETTLGPRW